jgi:hypothetical protein
MEKRVDELWNAQKWTKTKKKKDHSIGFSQKGGLAYLLLAIEVLNYSNWG